MQNYWGAHQSDRPAATHFTGEGGNSKPSQFIVTLFLGVCVCVPSEELQHGENETDQMQYSIFEYIRLRNHPRNHPLSTRPQGPARSRNISRKSPVLAHTALTKASCPDMRVDDRSGLIENHSPEHICSKSHRESLRCAAIDMIFDDMNGGTHSNLVPKKRNCERWNNDIRQICKCLSVNVS